MHSGTGTESSPVAGGAIARGVVGGILGGFLATIVFLLLFRFGHDRPEEMAAIYRLSPTIFFRYLSVSIYLGLVLGLSEFAVRMAGRDNAPLIYTIVGVFGLLRFFMWDGYPYQNDLTYVFFTFPDDTRLGVTCLLVVWMIIVGIIRRFQTLSVLGGSLIESAVILAFILRGMSNRWLSENHYELFSSALTLWVMLFTLTFCQRRNDGI